jgi:hypothetical protein
MKVGERRRVKRLVASVPLAFYRFSPVDAPVCLGEIVNISKHGILFLSSERIAPGTMLRVFPKPPQAGIAFRLPVSQRTGMVVHLRSWGAHEFQIGLRLMGNACVNEIAEKAIRWQPSV